MEAFAQLAIGFKILSDPATNAVVDRLASIPFGGHKMQRHEVHCLGRTMLVRSIKRHSVAVQLICHQVEDVTGCGLLRVPAAVGCLFWSLKIFIQCNIFTKQLTFISDRP